MSIQCSISCHPYRSNRNKFDPVIKMIKVSPGSSFEKKAPGYTHTTTGYKFWQHFKAFVIPIILYRLQKDPFCLIILYDILFYFIHVYIAPGQEETTLVDNFFDGSRKVLSLWSLVACIKNSSGFWFYAHIFTFLYMYIDLGQGQTTLRAKILMSTEWPHHFGHLLKVSKKSLQPLALYTSFRDLIKVYSSRSGADNPQGTKFWCQQKPNMSLRPFATKISLKSDFRHFSTWFCTCI